MEKFFNIIYRLRAIKRWGTSFNSLSEDVSQHCFSVAVLTHILCYINNDVYDREVNTSCAILCALYHESHESYTSHIVSPVKNSSNSMMSIINDANGVFNERLINTLPFELKESFSNILFCNDSGVKTIVNEADLIDAYCKCRFETSMGNIDFKNKMKIFEDRIKILRQEKDYINYFFENIIDFDEFELFY